MQQLHCGEVSINMSIKCETKMLPWWLPPELVASPAATSWEREDALCSVRVCLLCYVVEHSNGILMNTFCMSCTALWQAWTAVAEVWMLLWNHPSHLVGCLLQWIAYGGSKQVGDLLVSKSLMIMWVCNVVSHMNRDSLPVTWIGTRC